MFQILESIDHNLIPLPPPSGCPGQTMGCRNRGCPNTCYCEDHCSWEKCVIDKPKDCLADINSIWVWDSKNMYWTAQFDGRDKFHLKTI